MSVNTRTMLDAATFDATAKRVTDREVAAARLAPDYAALVAHFGLDHESSADTITGAARCIVLAGALQSGTKVGENLTDADLTGRDPGADAKHRDYWKAARAVRAGLVRALPKADGDDDKDVDWLTLIRQAVKNGMSHNLDADEIQAAVESVLYATRPATEN